MPIRIWPVTGELLVRMGRNPQPVCRDEYRYYVVDQFQIEPKNTAHHGTKDIALSTAMYQLKKKVAAVQIRAAGGKWKKPERAAKPARLQRGRRTPAGHTRLPFRQQGHSGSLPYWKESQMASSLSGDVAGGAAAKFENGKAFVQYCTGLPDSVFADPPLAVDFKGGDDKNWPLPDGNTVDDRSQLEMLLLTLTASCLLTAAMTPIRIPGAQPRAACSIGKMNGSCWSPPPHRG